MKKLPILGLISIALFALSANAQTTCANKSVEKLAGEIARQFEARNWGRLDAGRPYLSTFTVRVENSLSEDGSPGQYRSKRVKTFRAAENWLRKSEINSYGDIYPNRTADPLLSCRKGTCKYDLRGLLHNTLFLQRFTYGYKKNGCPYVKTVFLVDGD